MQAYQHILLAAEYSRQSQVVAARAQTLARLCQAKLSIVHVIDDIPLPDASYGQIIPLNSEIQDTELAEAQDNLLQLAGQLGADAQNCWLIWGNPKQEIELFAEKINAELIVVGSHNRHGLSLLLGSTADSILHHARCDVLAVHITD